MTCYFPLLGLSHGIVASLTYSSLTHNQRTATHRAPTSHAVDLALHSPESQGWRCIDRLAVPADGDLTITSSDYGLTPGELIVAVPVTRDWQADPDDPLLPLPYSKKVDRSPLAERCSLGFSWRGVSSSYQGEYPHRMAQLQRGTLVSFNPLFQFGPTVGTNLLCVVTLSRQIDVSEHHLQLFDARENRLVQDIPYAINRCCLVEITPQMAARQDIFVRSASSLGIPIIISLSREDLPASMSVEHTHPPTQLFAQRDRLKGSRMIKQAWLGASIA